MDLRPLGDGMSWVAVAMPHAAERQRSKQADRGRRDEGAVDNGNQQALDAGEGEGAVESRAYRADRLQKGLRVLWSAAARSWNFGRGRRRRGCCREQISLTKAARALSASSLSPRLAPARPAAPAHAARPCTRACNPVSGLPPPCLKLSCCHHHYPAQGWLPIPPVHHATPTGPYPPTLPASPWHPPPNRSLSRRLFKRRGARTRSLTRPHTAC